ncbi:MAG: AAA family ATPase [Candidatus Hadarchaeaceae archaeon]
MSSNHPFLSISKGEMVWLTPERLKRGDYVLASVLSNLKRPKLHFKTSGIRVPDEITTELAFLLGLLAGDGYVGYDNVTFTGKDGALHEKFKKIVTRLLGITKFKTYRGKAARTVVYSTEFVHLLNYLGFKSGKKDYRAFLERWLPAFDQELSISFILGLLLTDGTNKKYSLVIYSSDKTLLEKIKAVALSRGFLFKGSKIHQTKWSRMYRLVLSGKHNMQKFREIVKKIGLAKIEIQVPKRSYDYVPPPLMDGFKRIFQNLGIPYGQNWKIEPYLNKRKRPTVTTLEKLLKIVDGSRSKLGLEDKRFLNLVEKLVRREVMWDQVTEVTKEDEERVLYDLGTASENFVTAFGHVMHNSKWYGESEARLREVFQQAEKNAPSIVFIDELDAIAPKREEVTGEVERRVVATLCTALDGLKARGKVIVIGATNRVNALDPAIRRPGRFDREIEIGVPDRDGRKEILQIHTRGMPLAKDVNLDRYADITHGFVGADLEALAKEAAMSALRRILPEIKLEEKIIPPEVLEKLQVTREDFDNALRMAEPSAMREVLIEIPDVHWEDVGGLELAKQELLEAVEWPLKYPDAFKRVGIEPPHGILLYGPPGTGKTLLARAVATESEANFISIKGPELLSKWVGESEKGIRETFRKAKMAAPAIIFFDEIDALVPRRGSGFGDAHVTERVISQLLTELDGLEKLENVVVIGATNRPDLVDPALLRPGRFDRMLFIPAPDSKARLEIFKIHTKTMPLAKDVDLKQLAKETEGYAGSDIAALCREAAMLVLRKDIKGKEVRMEHFRKAIELVKPSLTPEMIKAYETFTERKSKRMAEEATGMHY